MDLKKGNIVIKQHPIDAFKQISGNFRRVLESNHDELIVEPNERLNCDEYSHIIRIPTDLLLHLGFEIHEEDLFYKENVFVRKEPRSFEYTIGSGDVSKPIWCLYELQNAYIEFTNGKNLDVSDFNNWSKFYPMPS